MKYDDLFLLDDNTIGNFNRLDYISKMMRDATKEESKSVEALAEPTGENFWEVIDDR